MSNWESWTISYRKRVTVWDWLCRYQPQIEVLSLKLNPRAGQPRQCPDKTVDESEIEEVIGHLNSRVTRIIASLLARKSLQWRIVALEHHEVIYKKGVHDYECHITLRQEY